LVTNGRTQKGFIELNTKSRKAQIAAAEANLKSAKQQLKSLNILINELYIKSPDNGIIGQKYYENGEYIKQNEKKGYKYILI